MIPTRTWSNRLLRMWEACLVGLGAREWCHAGFRSHLGKALWLLTMHGETMQLLTRHVLPSSIEVGWYPMATMACKRMWIVDWMMYDVCCWVSCWVCNTIELRGIRFRSKAIQKSFSCSFRCGLVEASVPAVAIVCHVRNVLRMNEFMSWRIHPPAVIWDENSTIACAIVFGRPASWIYCTFNPITCRSTQSFRDALQCNSMYCNETECFAKCSIWKLCKRKWFPLWEIFIWCWLIVASFPWYSSERPVMDSLLQRI